MFFSFFLLLLSCCALIHQMRLIHGIIYDWIEKCIPLFINKMKEEKLFIFIFCCAHSSHQSHTFFFSIKLMTIRVFEYLMRDRFTCEKWHVLTMCVCVGLNATPANHKFISGKSIETFTFADDVVEFLRTNSKKFFLPNNMMLLCTACCSSHKFCVNWCLFRIALAYFLQPRSNPITIHQAKNNIGLSFKLRNVLVIRNSYKIMLHSQIATKRHIDRLEYKFR